MVEELRVLFLEREKPEVELILQELRTAKMLVCPLHVETKQAFVQALQDFAPDLIIADYHLPDSDGVSAFFLARQQKPEVPFVFLTGKIAEEPLIDLVVDGTTGCVSRQEL
ncbi:MAG TPA: response regulator, partial [Acidobacteriota bacterium]